MSVIEDFCRTLTANAYIHRQNTARIPEVVFSMLSWAMTFLIIALIAAILGFGGIAGDAVGLAKIVFFLSIVLFIIASLMGRKTPGA
jgi:uncharacterized membrane protein YtjA (UPF0391 family)